MRRFLPIFLCELAPERSFYTGSFGEPHRLAINLPSRPAGQQPSPHGGYPKHFKGICWTRPLRLETLVRGGARSTPGFSPDPKFSLANSPVSPLDRLRLLTAPSNVGYRAWDGTNRGRTSGGKLECAGITIIAPPSNQGARSTSRITPRHVTLVDNYGHRKARNESGRRVRTDG